MSKINALRIINLNYNNNAIHIDDETFRFDGDSTLMSLRNGGGKSVIVQMMIAPFVHKSYRNTKDRPFTSFFTTNKPTFILVEWVLDGNVGYVLTGMMIRKNQNSIEAEEKDELEIINFVSEYKERCKWDINNLAVIENSGQGKKLKGFGYCKQLFENLKKDKITEFNYFDMNNNQQSKRYFEKLKEFQIDCKEWETIIKKINLKESGLSDLFAEAKDEKGLIEKWFLEAVENKLNKEKSRIKEFESLVIKYMMQYKENQSKIQRKEIISKFEEEAIEISKKAVEYKHAAEEQAAYENRIACLIKLYEKSRNSMELQKEKIEAVMKEIEEAIARNEYEEISCDIYRLQDKKELFIRDYELLLRQKEQAEIDSEQIGKKLHIQECAKYYKDYVEASRDQQLCENRLEIAKKEETELTPERERIGYNLKCRYEVQRDRVEKSIKDLENQIKLALEEEEKLKQIKSEHEKEKEMLSTNLGILKTKIRSYDEEEQNYNVRFGESLMRNILGEYEPATLELKNKEYADNHVKTSRNAMDVKKQKERLDEKVRLLGRQLEDMQKEDILCGELVKSFGKEIADYDEELNARRVIVQYVTLSEENIFNKEIIVEAFDKKIAELEDVRRSLEKEYDKIEKELSQLKKGTVLKLPKDFKIALDSLDIQHVYGMEWLKKNGKTPEENERLVDNNPFIPYAIILSKGDLEKLQKGNLNLYTSFPIPIIKREDLEKIYGDDHTSLDDRISRRDHTAIEEMDKVNFFVMFNKNLLDPEKLARLIQKKEEELQRKWEQIVIRKSELNSYTEKKELIKNHKVEKELYDKVKQNLEQAIKQKSIFEIKIVEIKDEQIKSNEALNQIIEEIYKYENELKKWKEQIEEFTKLCSKYEAYVFNKKSLLQLEVNIDAITKDLHDINERLEKLANNLSEARQDRYEKKLKLEEVSDKLSLYARYVEGELSNKDTEDLEARYKAITEKISNDQQLLEDQLRSAATRFKKCESQLIKKAQKYNINQQEYEHIVYDTFIENQLEEELEHKKQEIQELIDQGNHVDKNLAVLEHEIKVEYKRLKEKCNKEKPVLRENITQINFKKVTNEKKEEKRKEQEKLDQVVSKIVNYENSLSIFAEYSNFEVKEEIIFPENFDIMSAKDFSDYNGAIRRDYRQSVKLKSDQQGKLRDVLNKVARIEEFSEEFYLKPIEMLIELLDDADAVIIQLNTILNSYHSLMEKLLIDIAFIDREKEKVNELLLDYILEVHNNLGKIDKNSTITIRGKSIKMLRIILPVWEENETLYGVRIKDYIEELTSKALIAIDNNENMEELIGKRITTKNLYDAVIGISNIEIKLYKIEEQREYPITWAEVSKNSGGEGFLSAFVILSSLLYYMRRDDTDLFAEREEGKVLVMDNPFAQTNSSHLLKPLMDIAKKTNTQLICLSGLGGDSIYNRFDNIYVMNLVSSNMRKGMQYLKSEHIKGMEDNSEEMVLSRIMIEDESDGFYKQERLF